MQRLVIFDLDNTLVDRQGPLADWVSAFSAQHALDDDARLRLLQFVRERACPETFEAIRNQYGLAPSAATLWRDYLAHMARSVTCPAHVLEGLSMLRRAGWKVAIATNGTSEIQNAKVAGAGIADHVDAVCTSEAAGVRKPEIVIFEKAAAACGVDLAHGGWMVGDGVDTDIHGGSAAGLRTVWISGGRPWPGGDTAPDHVTTDVLQAIDLLLTTPSRGHRDGF
ncbi:noncanonical pyrimidine nucleotidase, YjjG family protein [Streptomyces albiflavescens]|uniref:Noncanonical pyrimidine nucleotidase, YjjG family protein n=1 Tax=Streptomyces albiflavescens TaxID=1623582 RepID=A0A918DBH6_9ACTN|nr:HAD family hydrolase [Streptomyces albiflavescens]GGN96832.1 noncanonical pyrimidine nucleotidase, YjjG family protein [Streptomyces albiflavescens]